MNEAFMMDDKHKTSDVLTGICFALSFLGCLIFLVAFLVKFSEWGARHAYGTRASLVSTSDHVFGIVWTLLSLAIFVSLAIVSLRWNRITNHALFVKRYAIVVLNSLVCVVFLSCGLLVSEVDYLTQQQIDDYMAMRGVMAEYSAGMPVDMQIVEQVLNKRGFNLSQTDNSHAVARLLFDSKQKAIYIESIIPAGRLAYRFGIDSTKALFYRDSMMESDARPATEQLYFVVGQ